MSKRPADDNGQQEKPPKVGRFIPIKEPPKGNISPLNIGESQNSAELEFITESLNSLGTNLQTSEPQPSPRSPFKISDTSAFPLFFEASKDKSR